MILAWSDQVIVVVVVAVFFILLAMLATGRSLYTRDAPLERRFRIGVFIERDREKSGNGNPPESESGPTNPGG